MPPPNVNGLWGRAIAEELAAAGVDAAVLAPGSRSTPLTVALAGADAVETVSLLDERSAAFFALGRAKRTGRPAAVVSTSGTAAVNFHPAVVEAHHGRVPLVVLTADRPPELQDSGANQTIDQTDLYGDAVRLARTLPEPEASPRKLRSLRTTVARAVAAAIGPPAGPVHLNCPFRKPLAPTEATDAVPSGQAADHPLAVAGRAGPFVRTTRGRPTLAAGDVDRLAETITAADAGLIVCGPTDRPAPSATALGALADATGFPVLADPLSGHRFGPHVPQMAVCGGYDAYLPAVDTDPDVVIRFGASPTSKPLREYLGLAARQVLVDPACGWREATFTASDLVVADESWLAGTLAERLDRSAGPFADRLQAIEETYWELVAGSEPAEGGILADAVALAPDPATLVVSNSMPVRDLDRFGQPRPATLTVLGNRGASGIDGVTSTAFGAASATDDPVVLVTGDLAYYHDMNGLLAIERAGVDATIVVVNNDGGGIFHMLPIADHETFDEWFRTPHGLDFAPTADLYDLTFARTDDRDRFRELYTDAVARDGTQVIEVVVDADASHRDRDALQDRVCDRLADRS